MALRRSVPVHELARLAAPQMLSEALEARRLFTARGLHAPSLRAYRNAWRSRLHLLPAELDLRRELVVDIGANEGNFTSAVLGFAPDARVIAVEPAPAPLARLRANFAGRPGVTVVGKAVSDHAGSARLHVTGHDHNSSLHRPREEMLALYEDTGWGVVGAVDVETTTLDALVAPGDDVGVIKLDVQGAELDVLNGAHATLERTRCVLMEVTFVSHYEDDADFQRLNRELLDRGFALTAISDPGRTRHGEVTWADACYSRRPSPRA
jgi:FkbM family methyltransferase